MSSHKRARLHLLRWRFRRLLKGNFDGNIRLTPHPEEPRAARRLEGWSHAPSLRPSFETLACASRRRAPQDEEDRNSASLGDSVSRGGSVTHTGWQLRIRNLACTSLL